MGIDDKQILSYGIQKVKGKVVSLYELHLFRGLHIIYFLAILSTASRGLIAVFIRT
jgi:hypothetical protein